MEPSRRALAGDVDAYYRYWREEVWEKRIEPDLDELARKGRYFNVGRGLVWNLKDYISLGDYDRTERT